MAKIIDDLKKLYDAGEYSKCIEEAVRALADIVDLHLFEAEEAEKWREVRNEIRVRMAWCYYKMQRYPEAKADATEANTERGDELLAQIAASVDKDFKALDRFRLKWPGNVGIANAWVTSAFNRTDVSHEDVRAAAKFFGGKDKGRAGVNIIRNAGVFFFKNSRSQADLEEAGRYIQQAIELWGTGASFDHRASAHGLASEVQEKLGKLIPALGEAILSSDLWSVACERDPKNQAFSEKRKKASDRVRRLTDYI